VGHEELDQLVVSPVGARVDSDHGVEGSRSLSELATAMMDDEAQLERVYVAAGGLQAFVGRGFDCAHVTALERFAAAKNQWMGGWGHAMNLECRVQTRLRRVAMVPASRSLV
jgi:hypothetical protein